MTPMPLSRLVVSKTTAQAERPAPVTNPGNAGWGGAI